MTANQQRAQRDAESQEDPPAAGERAPEEGAVTEADVDEDSRHSFPASDPPSTWWGGTGDPDARP